MGLNFGGMMKGLGVGMSQQGNIYADQIKQKEARDFQSSEARLAAERQDAMERRRLAAQKEEAKLGRDFTGEQNELNRGIQREQLEISRESQRAQIDFQNKSLELTRLNNEAMNEWRQSETKLKQDELSAKKVQQDLANAEFVDEYGSAIPRDVWEKKTPEEKASLMTKSSFQAQEVLDATVANAGALQQLTQDQRDAKATELESFFKERSKGKELSPTEELLVFGTKSGLDLSPLTAKTGKISAELFNGIAKQYEKGYPNATPEELYVLAMDQYMKVDGSLGTGGMLTGGTTAPKPTPSPTAAFNPEVLAAGVVGGDPDAKMALETIKAKDPKLYNQIKLMIDEGTPVTPDLTETRPVAVEPSKPGRQGASFLNNLFGGGKVPTMLNPKEYTSSKQREAANIPNL